MKQPVQSAKRNSLQFETEPLVLEKGFREYDARWLYPQQISLLGMMRVGMALGERYEAGLVGCLGSYPSIVAPIARQSPRITSRGR